MPTVGLQCNAIVPHLRHADVNERGVRLEALALDGERVDAWGQSVEVELAHGIGRLFVHVCDFVAAQTNHDMIRHASIGKEHLAADECSPRGRGGENGAYEKKPA